jgi:hypothetical protein
MLSEDKYFQTLSEDELWQRYCGFLDLSIDEFMEIQKELLMDEIEQVTDSTLGKKIMKNQKPKSVEEFRRMIPLTTYDDYEPYLSEQREDVLAIKPYTWCHSSGRGGRFKWVPNNTESLDNSMRNYLASWILASSGKKGRVAIKPGLRVLANLPPPPYASGTCVKYVAEHFSYMAIPPPEMVKDMEFVERMQKGFQIAMKEGVDILSAITSVLVRMGEGFAEQTRKVEFSPYMLHPKIFFNFLRGWVRSKKEKRTLLPKDLWSPKAIVAGGMDTNIYKRDVAHYWGAEPFDFYVTSDAFFLAMQAWNKKDMTFIAGTVFFEFIPVSERVKHESDKDYQPSTVLMNEVEEGKLYELVITHFFGLPLLRYRLGDIIKVVSLKDEETGINLPQIVIQGKVGETINLAGLVELDERTLWQAITNTGIRFVDWTACKEYKHNKSFLRIYIELKKEQDATEIETKIDEQLKEVDVDYRDIEGYLALQPVTVTLLSPGTFLRYTDEKRKEGADLAHLKPIHINATEAIIKRLLQLSDVMRE